MEKHTRLIYALEEIKNENTIDGSIAKNIYFSILKNKEISIKSISHNSYVSIATINRFCKRIKLNGFKELKTLANLEIKQNQSTEKLTKKVDLDSILDVSKEIIYKTWNENIKTAKNLLKEIKDNNLRIHILSTSNYFSEIFGLSFQLKMQGHYSQIFKNSVEWKKSKSIPADIVFCVTFSGDRKEIIKIINMKQNINKNAKYILTSSINPINIRKDFFYFNILGKSKKHYPPGLFTRQSLMACFNMISLIFTQNSKK